MDKIECPKCGWIYRVQYGVVKNQKRDKFVPTECPECGEEIAGRLKENE